MLVVLALLIVFHRPLLLALIHAVAVKVAARQNIELSLRIEGTIFTNLSLKNIQAVPERTRGRRRWKNISIAEVTVQLLDSLAGAPWGERVPQQLYPAEMPPSW